MPRAPRVLEAADDSVMGAQMSRVMMPQANGLVLNLQGSVSSSTQV